jgi:dTDP-4-dehydrorhamnose reductase
MPIELWGGHECTVNRIGDAFFDQTVRSGHQDRLSDLDLFAGLGVKALRYPVLWERVAPDHPAQRDFGWSDERLRRLGDLGVRPIIGLVHHGSGPAYTDLLDPAFAAGLADHARACAEQYPWVSDWTPVNEPLTTARFSALYGHWYPHRRDEHAFWTALLNQIDAVRLSMAQIRAVNPQARLIQTEDLGRTYSTPPVREQAEFDNARRWMTWDLLCGRVTPEHGLWTRLRRFGLADRLRAIADAPCPPDVLGINHYPTSDRFLDHRLSDYAEDSAGGNARVDFADVEALRVVQPAPGGLAGALDEAWTRYGRPLAVTEVHNGCTREEQVRWLRDAWRTATTLHAEGVQIEAVTAWSLLGAYDWNSLLTCCNDVYEPGAFDLRGGAPRPTAVAAAMKDLARSRPLHAAIGGQGWWDRDIRLQYRPVFRSLEDPEPRRHRRQTDLAAAPLMIVGARGALGQAFARACEWRGIDYELTDRRRLCLTDPASIRRTIAAVRPWAVVNAAGWRCVEAAEADPEGCLAVNAHGAVNLAAACADVGVQLATFSSDMVFDGSLGRAHVESDRPAAINHMGRSKALAEEGVLALAGRALIVRTASLFSPFDADDFVARSLRLLMRGRDVAAAQDLIASPTYTPDLVDQTLDLLLDGEVGIWHLANQGQSSWCELIQTLARRLGLDDSLVRPRGAASFGWAAPRPAFTPLHSERGLVMPGLDSAVDRYCALVAARLQAAESPALPAVAAA